MSRPPPTSDAPASDAADGKSDRRVTLVTSPGSHWRTVRRVDPLGPLLALVALVVFLLHGYQSALQRDLALYAYSGQRVADGVAPYVGVLNRAGPFGHMVNGAGALLAELLGTDDVLTMRVVMTVLAVLTVWVLYLLGRDLFGSRLIGTVAATSLLLFREMDEFATGGPREKTTMLLLVVAALWLILHRRWASAGVVVALATLTWQPSFFLAAPAAAGALLCVPGRELVRGMIRFAAGGIVTALGFGLVFWLWGALRDFLECFLLINLRYTDQLTGLQVLRDKPSQLYDGFVLDVCLLLVGFGALITLALLRLRRLDRADPTHGALVGLALATVTSVAWALFFALQRWTDVMVMTPLAVLGLAGLVQALLRRLTRRRRAVGPTAVAGVTALSIVSVAVAGWISVAHRSNELPQQRKQIVSVLAAAPAGATVASVGTPQVLVLGHRVNPSRYQLFLNGLDQYLADNYPGGLQGVSDMIAAENPTLLTFDRLDRYPFLQGLVDDRYTRIGRGPHFLWYANNDLSATDLRRLRQAVHGSE